MQSPENISQIAAASLDAARETPDAADHEEGATVIAPLSGAQSAASTRSAENDATSFQSVLPPLDATPKNASLAGTSAAPNAAAGAMPHIASLPDETASNAVTPAADSISQTATATVTTSTDATTFPGDTVSQNAAVTDATAQTVVSPDAASANDTALAEAANAENSATTSAVPAENMAAHEPPRTLFPGSFLGGEYEITGVLSRGLTNVYEAQQGDYGNTTPCLIAEREFVAPAVATMPQQTAPPSAETDASTRAAISLSADDAAGSGAFLEDVDTLPPSSASLPREENAASTRSETPSLESGLAANGLDVESEAAPPASIGEIQLEAPLFPPSVYFTQDDREYLAMAHFQSEALQDHREATNDERALAMLNALAAGLCELEAKKLHAIFSTDTLRVDDNGALRFLGFVGPASGNPTPSYLEQLRDCTAFILKRVFAESSTMNLQDEFGALAFSAELKEVARKISGGEYSRAAEAAEELSRLSPPGRKLRADAALLSDVGQERELNEDAGFFARLQRAAHLGARDYDLYVVADGMGGHEGGEVASDLTLSSLQNRLSEYSRDVDFDDNVAVRAMLLKVIDAVNADVVALTETPRYRATRAKPGATLCFALRIGARVFVGNVGDSRAYKFSAARGLERVSKDHSYVQTLIDRGELTEEEAFTHPDGSIITAHIGYPKLKTRDVFLRLFSPGDKLLIVSDGVTDMLRDREIAPFLEEGDSAAVCRALVNASNEAGGLDNITALCVSFS